MISVNYISVEPLERTRYIAIKDQKNNLEIDFKKELIHILFNIFLFISLISSKYFIKQP